MSRKLILLYGLYIFLASEALGLVLFPTASAERILLVAAVVTAIAVFPAILFRLRLQRSYRELGKAIHDVTAGNYGEKIYALGDGELSALGRSFNSMSERLAEQFAEVEEDRQQLRAILGGMVEGVVAIDSQQRVEFANERGGQLLEFNPVSAIGRKFWEVVRQRPIVGIVEAALDTAEAQRAEFDWKGNSGKSMSVHVSPLKKETGGAIIVLHDTSELRRLERLRHEFVANVSHELKTPLAVIKASVETLQEGAVNDLEHRDIFLAQIHDQAIRLNNLIIDLLSLARIESGAATVEPAVVVIADAVRDCFSRHQSRADAKNQTLEMIEPDEPSAAEIRTDEESFGQILDNLIDNAIKYTPEGSRIRIRWYGLGDQICFEVEDNGRGIPEEDLPRIFERFYRVDKARSRELGGTGLGLAIVKNLTHLLKGNVKVASELGKGTTFTFCLPRTPQ